MPRPKKPATTSATNSDPGDKSPEATEIAVKPTVDMTFLERVEQTVVWLLTGAREAEVIEAIRAMWPDQEIEPLTNEAIAELMKSADINPEAVRGWCFESTKYLYQRMTAIGDFAGALRAVKQLYEMAGKS